MVSKPRILLTTILVLGLALGTFLFVRAQYAPGIEEMMPQPEFEPAPEVKDEPADKKDKKEGPLICPVPTKATCTKVNGASGVKSPEIKKLKMLESLQEGATAEVSDSLSCGDPKWAELCANKESQIAQELCAQRAKCCPSAPAEAKKPPYAKKAPEKEPKPSYAEEVPEEKLNCATNPETGEKGVDSFEAYWQNIWKKGPQGQAEFWEASKGLPWEQRTLADLSPGKRFISCEDKSLEELCQSEQAMDKHCTPEGVALDTESQGKLKGHCLNNLKSVCEDRKKCCPAPKAPPPAEPGFSWVCKEEDGEIRKIDSRTGLPIGDPLSCAEAKEELMKVQQPKNINEARKKADLEKALGNPKCCAGCPPEAKKVPNNACIDGEGKKKPVKVGGKEHPNPCCDPVTCTPRQDPCNCCKENGEWKQGAPAKGEFETDGGGKQSCSVGASCNTPLVGNQPVCVAGQAVCDLTGEKDRETPLGGGVRDVTEKFYGDRMWARAKPSADCSDVVAFDPAITYDPTVRGAAWDAAVRACAPPVPPFLIRPKVSPQSDPPTTPPDADDPLPDPDNEIYNNYDETHNPTYIEGPIENKFECATSVGPGRIGPAPEFEVPAGCNAVFSFACEATDLDAGVMLPNNIAVEDAYVVRGADAEAVPVANSPEPTCGPVSLREIRETQIKMNAPDEYEPRQFKPVVTKSGTGTVQSEDLTVKLDPSSAFTVVGVSEVLPRPTNPGMRLFRPFKVRFDAPFEGGLTVTARLNVPVHIRRDSVQLMALAGDTWFPADDTQREDGVYTGRIDDVRSYLADNELTLAWAGAYCPTCPDEKLELAYDGGGSVAVIFVHGLTDERTRFQPAIDRAITTSAPYKVYTFSYPFDEEVESVAEEFAGQLNANSPEWTSVYVVSHSVGGPLSQLAVNSARNNGYPVAGKVKKIIMAGQPGTGSPLAANLKLLSWLPTQNTVSTVFGKGTPFYTLALNGLQVSQNPGTEPVAIVGTKGLPITQFDFTEENDGVVSVTSAARVHNRDLSQEKCSNYFEVDETHLEQIWAPTSTWTVWHVIAEDVATPEGRAVEVQDVGLSGVNCDPGDVVVLCGVEVDEDAAYDPTMCKCGNNVCGIGENSQNCPVDCPTEYPYVLLCRIAPYVLYPLLLVFLVITSVFSYGAIRRHERPPYGKTMIVVNAVLLGLVGLAHYVCKQPLVLGYVMGGFALALLLMGMAHGRGGYEARLRRLRRKLR